MEISRNGEHARHERRRAILARIDRAAALTGTLAALVCAGITVYLLAAAGAGAFTLPPGPLRVVFVLSAIVFAACGVTGVVAYFLRRSRWFRVLPE